MHASTALLTYTLDKSAVSESAVSERLAGDQLYLLVHV
jgi:hypothetical protein